MLFCHMSFTRVNILYVSDHRWWSSSSNAIGTDIRWCFLKEKCQIYGWWDITSESTTSISFVTIFPKDHILWKSEQSSSVICWTIKRSSVLYNTSEIYHWSNWEMPLLPLSSLLQVTEILTQFIRHRYLQMIANRPLFTECLCL